MKIKTKIRLGLIFLLAIIITLAGTGSFYINHLADLSSTILKDNYESLEYGKNMIQALDEKDDQIYIKKFEIWTSFGNKYSNILYISNYNNKVLYNFKLYIFKINWT